MRSGRPTGEVDEVGQELLRLGLIETRNAVDVAADEEGGGRPVMAAGHDARRPRGGGGALLLRTLRAMQLPNGEWNLLVTIA